MYMRKISCLVYSLLVLLAMPAGAQESANEVRTTLDNQTAVSVTIYNDNLALVKDRRRVFLEEGANLLAVREVSARMQPETAMLRSLNAGGSLRVIEQNFDFDLLSPEKLLEKYVGRTVQVVSVNPATGVETREEATVLAVKDGMVLRIGDRIETGIPGRIVYPEVPEDLHDQPTLVIHLESRTEGRQEVELSYLTSGLSWQADYVAQLGPQEKTLALSGLVTLTNQSGTDYRDARLQLVAGEVHRVRPEMKVSRALEARAMAAPAAEMAEEALFDYHLYTLERRTTLADNQTKQVALLEASGVSVQKEYVLTGQSHYYTGRYDQMGDKRPVAVFLHFVNSEEAGLGIALPKGTVRVYQSDRAGRTQFLGEDRIDHTPKNEEVRLRLGEAFDVTARRVQTDFQKLGGGEERLFETAYRVELKNARKEAVTVQVVEPMPGDWEILSESHPHQKKSAREALWKIRVSAEGEVVLEYRARVRL